MTRLFAPASGPRVFALPPGTDFIGALAAGLDARLAGFAPEAAADVTVLLNTRRAARALEARLAAGPARLLPRIGTVADLAEDPLLARGALPAPVPPLRRRLELARLVRRLLRATGLAPESAAFGLADSLAALIDELGGAAIDPARLGTLDAGTHAKHWRQTLGFLDIAVRYAAEGSPGGEARQRAAVDTLARRWASEPPQRPILVAGSTGSRAPTRALMNLVARLPQGAVLLPGLDADLPPSVWARLRADDAGACDHPQHAFRALSESLGFDPASVPPWHSRPPANAARNALIALALRPAPVTDQWRAEAPAHRAALGRALADLAWIDAPGPEAEADAIALALREAAETGRSAALVTPDRTIARRVTARLARWGIIPDDSAGRPLALTPPGILLTLVAGIPPGRLPALTLLALLKHPLANAPGRGTHLRLVQALETDERALAGHPTIVDWVRLAAWASARDPAACAWLDWLRATLESPLPPGEAPLALLVARHRQAAEALSAGPAGGPATALWDKAAGEGARAVLDALAAVADAAEPLTQAEYQALLASLLHARSVPEEAQITHRGIAIWGTLEARSQWADRVVLAGLNEGTWPGLPEPDPWLSRPLRRALGLPAPETLVGLSAHDFTLAAAAPEVILVRAVRDAEAPTVPSRWLLRLENLLSGLGPPGEAALAAARDRGEGWLALARRLDAPAAPEPAAHRPAPIPPLEARPRRLSVTQIETLIRDPYSVYARAVLRLRPLVPPGREADALARGTALHAVMEAFVTETEAGLPPDAEAALRSVAARILAATPWPAIRAIWAARLDRSAAWIVATEAQRRARAAPLVREVNGVLDLPAISFTLDARADRIDRMPTGALAIYDYKSGGVPSDKETRAFHVQLPLEAAIAASGGFHGVPAGPVAHLELIGLGRREIRSLDPTLAEAALSRLTELLAHYLEGRVGFAARLRPQRISFAGDYDHLSRYGEWSDGDDAVPTPIF